MSEIIEEPSVVESKSCDNENNENNENNDSVEHDPHYDPIISLPEVEVPTLEEDETVMLNLRAKLYRFDANETPPEWKERGTGNVKILRHKVHDTVRVVMRRDKTLKLCANHLISPFMTLKPSSSCKRAWLYSVKDFSDATVKNELLAIKFANIEHALMWKEIFEEAKQIVANHENAKGDSAVDEKIISEDSPKLNDTFEEDKKISPSDKKEETTESTSPKKQSNVEVTEKLSAMTIKETEKVAN